jgi:23S rRNA pseudouridine1911/1915/1917 synthase
VESLRISVEEDAAEGCRLDRYIVDHLDLLTRSQLKARAVTIAVNGRSGKLASRVRPGDLLEIAYELPEAPALEPEPMDLDVLYEDADAVVVNKAQGVVVHPGCGHYRGTLIAGLLHHCGALVGGEPFRPGVVHRLDKDTSGVIIVAKSAAAHQILAEQFRLRATRKVYYALVQGSPPLARGVIDLAIERDPAHRQKFRASIGGGREASTGYRLVRAWPGHSLLRFAPRTGRTHQLRVHARAVGCPIVGDPIYGRPDPRLPGATLMLHAYSLAIRLPGRETARRFRAPLPDHFRRALALLEEPGPGDPA